MKTKNSFRNKGKDDESADRSIAKTPMSSTNQSDMFKGLMDKIGKSKEDIQKEQRAFLEEKKARRTMMGLKRDRMTPFQYSKSFIKANPLK